MPDLVLYQPDIAGNTGTLLRLAACLDFQLHIIEPAGFRLDDTNLKRAGMDYLELAKFTRHINWASFQSYAKENQRRIILLSTKAQSAHTEFEFQQTDLLLLGRESSGVPPEIHEASDASILIPMQAQARSINVALAGSIVMGEALRQTNSFPPLS